MKKNIQKWQSWYCLFGVPKFKNRELEKELQYYNSFSESFEQLRKLRHDSRKHFSSIQGLLQLNDIDKAKKYLNSINGTFEATYDICTLEDKLLAIMFTEKFQEARTRGVKINHTMMVAPCFYKLMNKMDDTEKTSLFSNLLDNAIEAAENTQKKYIDFQINAGCMENHEKIEIICINSVVCGKEIQYKKIGVLKTTKKNKNYHGIGTEIIQEIVTKYHGIVKYTINNNTFSAKILFEMKV